jgi:hypothetical protein
VPILLLVLLLVPAARTASARPRQQPDGPATPTPLLPAAGVRVDEGSVRFEVSPAAGVADARLVITRFAFDPSGWSTVPSGPAWTIVPCAAEPIALQSLGLVDHTETKLWWAVVWTDPRTGRMRASEVRQLTVVPRFANRVAVGGALNPSLTGRLPERQAPAAGGARRAIELAAGYSLTPNGPAPVLPVALSTARTDEPAAADARAAYIVQFADDAPDSARNRIARSGGAIVWPVSGGGYLVRMNASAASRLQQTPGEPWVAPYEPAYKLSPALDLSATGRVDVTALLFMDGDQDAAVATLRALGATNLAAHHGELNHLVRFELDRSQLAQAAALADVAWIEPSAQYSFNNDKAQWVTQSGVPDSRPVTARGIRGQDQVVEIADSGLRTNHDMFNDTTQAITTWGNYPTHRKVIAYLPGSDSPLITFGDDVHFEYHGTHTSGTIAGNPDPYSGAPWSGMAKDAKLFFMDLAGTDGLSLRVPDDLNELYLPSYIGNAGGAARISSNSWGDGGSQGRYTLSSMQTDQFAWAHPDYLIAFASGNAGVFGSVQAPGTAKDVLTVGATGNGTLENTLASFSSRGPTRDGRRKPTVMAPGDIVTSSIGSTRYTYEAYSGTSMATPAVAGSMALVRQYLTDGWYPTGAPVAANAFKPSAALLRAMAVNAGRNDVTGFRVPDNTIGYGRLTLDDVLYFPGDSTRTLLVDTPDGLTDQQFVEYQVQVADPSRPLKIALCWTDAPGNPASQVQLVNDLDLVVTHGTSSYRGNFLLNYVSVAGGTRDSLNVEEIVRLPAPASGLWTVRVEGHHVVQGPQPFALCITGGVGGAAGAVALDRFQYGLRDTVGIEVIDTDATGPVTARVHSSTESFDTSVLLTGGNGVFRGSIPIGPELPLNGDGVLAVTSGDLVTVSYIGSTPAQQVVATAAVNVETPVISSVHATALGTSQAVVSWTTNVLASSRVHFAASGPLVTTVDSSGHSMQHTVLLTGLHAGTTYRYDVESSTALGAVSADSLGGQHRSFTTRAAGAIALLMDDPDPTVLATWTNAFAALGWDVDVLASASNDPPLVGNTSAGLRKYDAVIWQVDQNRYPPFSDAQRTAIDSLLNAGGRLLVTGHDIGFGLSDAGAPSYTPAREAWLESGLKTRYYIDNLNADTLTGVANSPVSGAYTGSLPYYDFLYPDAGDNVGPAPATDGVWSPDWTDNFIKSQYMGMHWESNTPRGTNGVGVWGGKKSRLVGLFYEWRALAGSSTAHLAARTDVLQRAVSWLMGHTPPEVHILAPAPATVVTDDFLAIKFSLRPDAGRTITSRAVDFSLDGGESWAPATTVVYADSGGIWDLRAALGGLPTPNSTRVMLRVRVTDDGAPVLSSTAVMTGTFTLARAGGDTKGPVLVGGSATCSPQPVRRFLPATLTATLSDAESGGGGVAAAEYSIGTNPTSAGSGIPMSGSFGGATVQASAALATDGVVTGTMKLWLRGRDTAGNWGAAAAFTVPTSGPATLGVDDAQAIDFLANPSPNPLRSSSTIRFGLARAGAVHLELFDVSGRRVQTLIDGILPPGPHVASWNGLDQHGDQVRNGVYFLRFTTPARQFHARVIVLK